MFERGDDARLVLERRVALEPAHRRDAELRDQVRVFAVGLLDASPARIARHVHHRRQRLVRAAHARFLGRHREERFDQLRIERGAQADGLRKAGGAVRGVAVQAFLVEHHRDAEAGVLDEELLDGVGQLGHLRARSCLCRRRWAGRPGRGRGRA